MNIEVEEEISDEDVVGAEMLVAPGDPAEPGIWATRTEAGGIFIVTVGADGHVRMTVHYPTDEDGDALMGADVRIDDVPMAGANDGDMPMEIVD